MRPYAAAVLVDDALDGGEADTVALKVLVAVEALKGSKEFFGMLHVETNAIVANEESGLAICER